MKKAVKQAERSAQDDRERLDFEVRSRSRDVEAARQAVLEERDWERDADAAAHAAAAARAEAAAARDRADLESKDAELAAERAARDAEKRELEGERRRVEAELAAHAAEKRQLEGERRRVAAELAAARAAPPAPTSPGGSGEPSRVWALEFELEKLNGRCRRAEGDLDETRTKLEAAESTLHDRAATWEATARAALGELQRSHEAVKSTRYWFQEDATTSILESVAKRVGEAERPKDQAPCASFELDLSARSGAPCIHCGHDEPDHVPEPTNSELKRVPSLDVPEDLPPAALLRAARPPPAFAKALAWGQHAGHYDHFDSDDEGCEHLVPGAAVPPTFAKALAHYDHYDSDDDGGTTDALAGYGLCGVLPIAAADV